MTTATALAHNSLDLGAIARALAPGQIRFDLFGLVSGYKTYRIFTALDAKSDAELAEMGLTRDMLPRAAIEAVDSLRG